MANLQTRREFLKTSGKVLAGVALTGAALPLMNTRAETAAPTAPAHPYEYVRLDPQAVLERGYQSFYKYGGCGMGAFDAIIGQLADVQGYPHNQIPVQMLSVASAGFFAGTLCGSLAGAMMAIGLLCEPAEAKEIQANLFAWYKEHPFPEYQPKFKNPTTVSGSIDCLDSCSKFMEAAQVRMGDDERKARCAAVTGETAAKAIELLNAARGL